ncbi:MAG: hypothetical protein HKN93_08625 [Acidimicrobiia bacterium]|nr:hypothetical protein [Acidimicrobiia bacterium]
MSVLPGEGTVPILFGSMRVAVGPRIHDAYLTRPDLTGAWPTVILLTADPASSTRAFARRLARNGLAVVVTAPGASSDVRSFVANPASDWSSGQDGRGLLGIAAGGEAAFDGKADAVAVIGVGFEPGVSAASPVLALFGQDDPASASVEALRAALPQAEVVLYGGVGAGFHDDAAPGFDLAASDDAVDRLVEFFTEQLPPAPTA